MVGWFEASATDGVRIVHLRDDQDRSAFQSLVERAWQLPKPALAQSDEEVPAPGKTVAIGRDELAALRRKGEGASKDHDDRESSATKCSRA